MGILQEYRFFLIIALIALAGVIALFFVTQTKQEYVSYGTEFVANYAEVKSIAGENKSLSDVVSIDGTTLLGTKGNALFGKILEWNAEDILIVDEDGLNTIPNPSSKGNYTITFIADQGVRGDSIALKDIVGTDNNITKGWNLPSKGTIIYSFFTKADAQEVINNYIPEGTLVDNKVVVDFFDQSLPDFRTGIVTLLWGTTSTASATPGMPSIEFSMDETNTSTSDVNEGSTKFTDIKYVIKDVDGNDTTDTLTDNVLIDVTISHVDTDVSDFMDITYSDITVVAATRTSFDANLDAMNSINIYIPDDGVAEGREAFTLTVSNIRLWASDTGYTTSGVASPNLYIAASTAPTPTYGYLVENGICDSTMPEWNPSILGCACASNGMDDMSGTYNISANATCTAGGSSYGYLVENNICDSTMPEWNPGNSSCACASNGIDDTGGTYNIGANATCSIQASGTFTSGTINIGTQTAFATEWGIGQQIYIQLQADSGVTYPLTGDMTVYFSLTSSSSFSNSMNGLDVAGFNNSEYYSITLPGWDLDTLMTPYVLNVINDSTAEPREYADIVIDRIELDPGDSSVMLTGVVTGMDTQPVTVELSDGYVPVVSKALEFSGNSFFVAEGKTNLNPADTMTAPLYQFSFNDDWEYFPDDITITYQYQGTWTDPITSGDLAESLNTNYSVTIPAGQTSVYIQDLTFVADTVNEWDEQFQVVIQSIDYGPGNNGSSASWDSMDPSYIITIPANSL